MIYLEFLDGWKKSIIYEKQQEIMRRVKKDISHSEENLVNKSEKNGDNLGGEIIDLKIAPDGSLRTYVKDRKEPISSYADYISVNAITGLKRFIPMFLNVFSEAGWIKKIIFLLSAYYGRNIMVGFIERYFDMFPVLLKEEHWSHSVKEIRRVLKGKINNAFIEAISAIIEYDSAYKNRFQDILSQLNKENLADNPLKEVMRLFNVLQERDYDFMNAKWSKMGKIASYAMLIPKIRRKVVSILEEINLNEIKFSKEEMYWINQMPSYNYLGKTLKERQEDNIKIYGSIN